MTAPPNDVKALIERLRAVSLDLGVTSTTSIDSAVLREAADALARFSLRPEWQPIESAPKDGTRLWLFFPTRDEDDQQQVGWWHDTISGAYWVNHADSDMPEPSHWRPLPAPPQLPGGAHG
jgi:hypothetical protein